jgi:hypothetical protein
VIDGIYLFDKLSLGAAKFARCKTCYALLVDGDERGHADWHAMLDHADRAYLGARR